MSSRNGIKKAIDITLVYVQKDEAYEPATETDILGKLTNNELVWWGELTTSTNGKTIVHLCDKEEENG
jgi:hypothetical protein